MPPPCAASPEAGEPLVLVEKMRGALRIAGGDAVAARLGLVAGQTLADARACHPGLVTVDADPAADARWLDRLAARCVRFTPMVAIEPPDALVLDITGCAHLFGGEDALVAAAVATTGMTVRHALAPTAAAARALARFGVRLGTGEGDVRALPVAALECPDAEAALKRAGLRTIGDLAVRPMAGLAARFGGDLVERLRRILGEAQAPIAPVRRLPAIRAERRFAHPVLRTDDAIEVVEELLVEACTQLEERHRGGRHFVVTLCRSDGQDRRLAVETTMPVRDPAAVLRLVRERIDGLSDPVDPGFGFDAIRLAVPLCEPLAAGQLVLDAKGDQGDADAAALTDRLAVRLGRGNVRRLVPGDTHIPEQAQLALPAIDLPAPVRWPAPTVGEPPLRPIFLFDPPQPIAVTAEVPDGPPRQFRWRRRLHDVRLYEGPERIVSEWWRRKAGHVPGQGGLTRDYYRIEDVRGRRFWVFRHGLFAEKSAPAWFIHGLFA